MKKQLQFLSIIATLLCLTNCQTEDIATETNNTHNEISIIRKKFSGFQKLPGLTNKVFEDSNLLKRGDSNNPLYDFEIDSTSVTQMEKEGNIYYTMAISRATTTEESFENLVVSDDAQQAYIFKYYPSAEYLQKKMWMQHPQYSGGIQITEIEYDQLSSRGSCVSVSISFCKNGPPGTRAGECCYASTADGGAGDGGAHVITITYEVCSDDEFLHITQIIADPAPGSSNGGGGAGGSGGGSPAPGSYPAGSPPTPTPSNPNSPLAPVTDPGGNPVLTEPVMLSNSIRLFVRDLDVLQKAWWNNPANAVAVGIITDYLNDNGISNETNAFGKWAVEYLRTHPNVMIEQFKNWFMTPREGKDFFYDEEYWEDTNLSFPQQALPSFDDFDSAYPRQSGASLVQLIGGPVQQAYIEYPSLTRGYCALKVSRALNYAGISIPQIITTTGNPGTVLGGDGKYYFLNAKALNKWMRETFGTFPDNPNHYNFTAEDGGTNGENFPTLVAGLKGIYSMVSTDLNWASGHADLINEGECVFGCHYHDTPPAPIDYIDIWILE